MCPVASKKKTVDPPAPTQVAPAAAAGGHGAAGGECPVRRKPAASGDSCPVKHKNKDAYNVYGVKLDPTNMMPTTAQQLPVPGQVNPQPSTFNPQPETRNPKPETRNPKPETRNPQPSTLNPQPSTLNPHPLKSLQGVGVEGPPWGRSYQWLLSAGRLIKADNNDILLPQV